MRVAILPHDNTDWGGRGSLPKHLKVRQGKQLQGKQYHYARPLERPKDSQGESPNVYLGFQVSDSPRPINPYLGSLLVLRLLEAGGIIL